MPRMHALALMIYLLSSLLRGLDGIICASSSLVGTTVLLEPKQCADGVEHCLLTLERSKQSGEEYERHSYGCWPWQELKFNCPNTLGVCQLLHTSGDDLYKTCCCYGDMCNNQTLEYLPIPNSTADHMDDITDRIAKFGIRDANNPLFPVPSNSFHKKNSSNFLPSNIVNVLLPCLIGLILILTLVVILLRFSSSTQALRRKFSTMNTFQHRDSHSHTRTTGNDYPCVCLLCCGVRKRNQLSSTAPVFAGDSDDHPGLQSGLRVGSMNHTLVTTPEPGASLPSSFLKFDPMEWSVMQLVSQSCKTERCLGRGRFAQVWLARIPAEVLLDPSEVLRRTSASVSNHRACPLVREEHQSDCSRKPIGSDVGNWCKRFRLQTNNHMSAVNTVDRNPQLAAIPELEGLLPSAATSSLDDNLCGDGFGVASPSDPLAKPEACTDYESRNPDTEDALKQVAVKVFLPHESGAWSNELTVFRALQQHSVHLESVNKAVRSSGIKRYPDVNPNVIRLFGAGIVNEIGFKSTLKTPMVREYRLIMEFASGGSLRNLLSSGEWIPLKQVVQLCRDITSGLTFLHSDSMDTTLVSSLFPSKPPIAHRDLKPENILLRSDGSACLSDFGQAVIIDFSSTTPFISHSNDVASASDPGRTVSGSITPPNTLDAMPKAGTLRYMAPELLDGAINFTGVALLRTDIYSLGLVLWELICAVLLPDLSPVRAHTAPKTEDDRPSVSRSHVCHKRRHWLPYERELGENCGSPYAMRQWVSAEKHRPLGDPAWYEYAPLAHIYRTISECWDPEPEARLTADCILERINWIQADVIKRCLQGTSEPTSCS